MLSVDEAIELLLAQCPPPPQVEAIPLANLHGRILASDVCSLIDSPPMNNSQMDGFALRQSDWHKQTKMPIAITCAAGEPPKDLPQNQVARIFTGALIPHGADCVVMQEICTTDVDGVQIAEKPTLHQFVRFKGEDIKRGAVIGRKGDKLSAQHISLLASSGLTEAPVYKPLNIHVITSGNELIAPGEPLELGQIYDSNTPLVVHHMQQWGFNVTRSHVMDDLEQTKNALLSASKQADFIITTGGVSVGEKDYMRAAVESLGEIIAWKVLMKPGKPIVIGTIGLAKYIGLPGNPVSAFVTLQILAKPLLMKAQGLVEPVTPSAFALADFHRDKANERREFLRARIQNKQGQLYATIHDKQQSNALSATVWASALIEIPENSTVNQGDILKYHRLD